MSGTPLKILSVASEVYPLVKTGGLADVVGALPAALKVCGIDVTTLVPAYPRVFASLRDAETVHTFPDLFGGPARLLRGHAAGLDLLAIDAAHLFARSDRPYQAPDGSDWPDNAIRFAALGAVAAALGLGEIPELTPDIVHGHDWQAGLAPAYMAYAGRLHCPTVMTIHNIAFAGAYPRHLLGTLGLLERAFVIDGVEFYGQVGFLKAGLQLCDAITTVSPTYATEIQTPEFGHGLDGLLRARRDVLTGILNGVDVEVWNPATDAQIAAVYDAETLTARAENKTALQERLGLAPEAGALLLGLISRMSAQKGLDVVAEMAGEMVAAGCQLAVLGGGERDLEHRFLGLAQRHPGRVGVVIGYDEALAHVIQAGADALLVPSRFEPCGLTQLCALRYGAVPIVARTGGLNDSIIDANVAALNTGVATGIQFAPITALALQRAIDRALALWAEPSRWEAIQRNGMRTDVSWSASAAEYAALYRRLVAAG